MQDPKYKFGSDDYIYHRISKYVVDKNEPVMLLRGKDVTSLAAIIAYVSALLEMDDNEVVNSHLDSSLERLKTIYLYQMSGVSGVGCSQKHHSNSQQYLTKAKDLLVILKML